VKVRQPTAEEYTAHFTSVDAAFGAPTDPKLTNREAMAPPPNRLVVLDGQRIIGGCSRYDSRLSLPGGAWVPVAALSGVGVEPGVQGRGALRSLMRAHLDDCRARGDAASVLIASQAPIYGRFGFGAASSTCHWEVDGTAAGLVEGAPTTGTEVRLDHRRDDPVFAELDRIWRAAGSVRAGSLTRSRPWWEGVFSPHESWLGGGKLMLAMHESGYLTYTTDVGRGRQGLAEAEISIQELVAVDVGTELDLWRFAAALPWARRIKWHYAPTDPAALFWLRDPRHLRRMAHFDMYWLRPLDLVQLIEARAFTGDGDVVLEVADPIFDDLAGRFELRVRDGEGGWRRTDRSAQLRVTVGDLGAFWLGGASPRQLLAVGRIEGEPAAAATLDRLLSTDGPPRSVARF